MTFPTIPRPVNPTYPNMILGGFKAGDRVRIGQSPYVFYVHSIETLTVPQGQVLVVHLDVPGMTGRTFGAPFDVLEMVND